MPHEVHVWRLARREDGRIQTWTLEFANQAALRAWKRELPDVLGKTTDEIFPDSDATETFRPVVEKIFEDRSPQVWERYFGGSGQILQMVSVPLDDVFISAGLDVTELRRRQEQIRAAQKMAAIGQLAGGIAHDFNNQLTGILGYAELLLSTTQSEEDRELLGRIQSAALRSSDLTKQLLAFARRGKVQRVPVDVEALIEESLGLLERSTDKLVHIDKSLGRHGRAVAGDPGLLQNALLNLVLNARDAVDEGGHLWIRTKVVRRPGEAGTSLTPELPAGAYLRIEIEDDGVGMTEEVQAQMFEPFYTTKESGTGMGLASVQGTVESHGGAIVVDSAVGRGTLLQVYLPVSEPAPTREAPTVAQGAGTRRLRLLIVDDEPLVRDLCVAILERAGHEVMTASDGPSALAVYRERWSTLDAVVLDMVMPHQSGLEVFREMKRINPSVKALLATGYSAEQAARDIQDAGIDGVVQKPFQTRALQDALARLIETDAPTPR